MNVEAELMVLGRTPRGRFTGVHRHENMEHQNDDQVADLDFALSSVNSEEPELVTISKSGNSKISGAVTTCFVGSSEKHTFRIVVVFTSVIFRCMLPMIRMK